jgi:hypothetical protein
MNPRTIGAVLINIQSDQCYISCCMIDQKPKIELQVEYCGEDPDFAFKISVLSM